MSITIQKLSNIYLITTVFLFIYTFSEVYNKSSNYFSAWLIYLDDTVTNFIFYNMIFSIGIIAYKVCISLFFVEVKENESIKIVEKLKARIMDILLLVYIMDGQLEMDSFACVIFVFFSYILHSMAMLRVQYLIHAPATLNLQLNYRLTALLLILVFFDFEILYYSFQLLYSESVTHFVFVYYTITISLSLIQPTVKYFLDFYEKYTLSHIRNIDERLALITLWISIPRLIIQILLAFLMVMRFNLFFYLIFNVIQLVSQLTTVIKSYNRVKKLTETMKNLKKINQEEINKHHDHTCMVCFQDMQQATLLPCSHFFHDQCLRQWIIKNSNHFCPKCKKQFNFELKQQQQTQQRRQIENNLDIHQNDQQMIEKFRKQRLQRLEKMKKKISLRKDEIEKEKSKTNKNKTTKNQIEKESLNKQTKQNQIQKKNSLFYHQFQNQQKKDLNSQNHLEKLKKQSAQNFQQNPHLPNFQTLSQFVPKQILQDRRNKYSRIGSIAYGLPTQAVYRRTYRHMYLRDNYERVNQQLLRYFSLKQYAQMMLFADH